MSDDKRNVGPADRDRINVNEDYELRYWTQALGVSADELDAIKLEACRKNGLEDCYLRPIAWRGSEMIGVSAQQSTIHLAVAVWDWPSYFDPEQKGSD